LKGKGSWDRVYKMDKI